MTLVGEHFAGVALPGPGAPSVITDEAPGDRGGTAARST
jgi:hypothetical protein